MHLLELTVLRTFQPLTTNDKEQQALAPAWPLLRRAAGVLVGVADHKGGVTMSCRSYLISTYFNSIYGCFHTLWTYPKMEGLEWKIHVCIDNN